MEKRVENFLMRVWLETIQNIVGENGLKSILNYAHLQEYIGNFPPDDGKLDTPAADAQALFLALYELFGKKGSRSLSLRAGREFARLGIEGRSGIAKALQTAAYLVPEATKMRLVLNKIVDQYGIMYTFQIEEPYAELIEKDDHFLLIFKDYFECEGITSDVPLCNINTGMVHFLMKWITGHEHTVQEIKCKARGDLNDVFKIYKKRRSPEDE
jgi:predicted hydrocarbon binding protein